MYDSDGPDGGEPDVPPWFRNQDDTLVEEEPAEPTLRRRLIVAAAVLIIVVLLLIPVLQAALLQDRQDDLPDEQFQRAALQFTSAVFFSRSIGQAMLFASDEARDQVESVVVYYRDMPPNSARARVQVGSTPCPREWGAARECFTGRLFDRDAGFLPGILFGLAEEDDEPAVVFVRIDQTSVRGAELSRS